MQLKEALTFCVLPLCLRTPLHYAAANGRYQCTVTLVSAGAEVNEPDQTGCTPLHYSAASQAFSRWGKILSPSVSSQKQEATQATKCSESKSVTSLAESQTLFQNTDLLGKLVGGFFEICVS